MRGRLTSIDASVVVPVFNPGTAIDPCVSSLLSQTLPAERRELIFVDDGSTDGTGERLDRLASEHDDVQVIHLPNSGWPGKPRNVGVDSATGEFVQFVDHDDTLGPEALERLIALARANDSDIIIGKVTSNFRGVPYPIFRKTVGRCSIWDTPLINSLTPHKMFRRSFLVDRGIRYPEGKVRLEDQLFMVKSYFATSAVSILADYPCYFYNRRADGNNAAATNVSAADYYGYLREVLDVIEANTEPGEFRDEQYRRFLRVMTRRMGALVTTRQPEEIVTSSVSEVQKLVRDRFSDRVADRLPTLRRLQTTALMAGRLDRLAALTAEAARVRASVRLQSMAWSRAGWTVQLQANLICDDGSPLALHPAGTGWTLDPRLAVAGLSMPVNTTSEILEAASAEVWVFERTSRMQWFVPADLRPCLESIDGSPDGPHRLVFTGAATLDPATVAGGRRLGVGHWYVSVDLTTLDISRSAGVQLPPDAEPDPAPVLLGARTGVVMARSSGPNRRLSMVVRRRTKRLPAVVAGRVTDLAVSDGVLAASLDLRLPDAARPVGCHLILLSPAGESIRLPATIAASPDGAVLTCDLAGSARRLRGVLSISLQFSRSGKTAEIGSLETGWRGRVRRASPVVPPPATRGAGRR